MMTRNRRLSACRCVLAAATCATPPLLRCLQGWDGPRARKGAYGGLSTQADIPSRPSRPLSAAAAAVRRASDRDDPQRPARGLRNALFALPRAAAVLLRAHAG